MCCLGNHVASSNWTQHDCTDECSCTVWTMCPVPRLLASLHLSSASMHPLCLNFLFWTVLPTSCALLCERTVMESTLTQEAALWYRTKYLHSGNEIIISVQVSGLHHQGNNLIEGASQSVSLCVHCVCDWLTLNVSVSLRVYHLLASHPGSWWGQPTAWIRG